MKLLLLAAIIFITAAVFASAKTKTSSAPSYKETLRGSFQGSYSIAGGPTVNEIYFDFDKGKLTVTDGGKTWGEKANASYEVNGDSITGSFIYQQGIQLPVKFRGRLSADKKIIEGSWYGFRGSGSFHMKNGS